MIRVTIDLIPHGIESAKQTIGLMEIANDGTGDLNIGNYQVWLKKTPPFSGALHVNWKKGKLKDSTSDDIMQSEFEGFHRIKRGVYDLLYRALVACGIDKRNTIPKNLNPCDSCQTWDMPEACRYCNKE